MKGWFCFSPIGSRPPRSSFCSQNRMNTAVDPALTRTSKRKCGLEHMTLVMKCEAVFKNGSYNKQTSIRVHSPSLLSPILGATGFIAQLMPNRARTRFVQGVARLFLALGGVDSFVRPVEGPFGISRSS